MTEYKEETQVESSVNDSADATKRKAIRERYGGIAVRGGSCCGGESSCGDGSLEDQTRELGYSQAEVEAVETGANMGLGCGNPTVIASLEEGETVLDLGSGGGFDCFLAAREVGESGRVIGVDMTPAMVEKARYNTRKNETANVEFRLGEIEHLPIADETVDVVISNCVVNLSLDKPQVFREAYRVLRPGGRLAISDVVSTAELPPEVRSDTDSLASCISGAAFIGELERMLTDAGFVNVSVTTESQSESFIREWDPERDLSEYLVSATIEAERPSD